MTRMREVLRRVPPLRHAHRRWRAIAAEARAFLIGIRAGLLGEWASRLSPFGNLRVDRRQAVLRHPVCLPPLNNYGDLLAWLRARKITYKEGGWTVYLPPQPGLRETLGEAVGLYPNDAGFKILKDLRPPEKARYVPVKRKGWDRKPASTWMQSVLSGTTRAQVLSANVLWMRGVGPRLYDLVSLQGGSTALTAFVVKHVAGGTPDPPECGEMLARIAAMEESGDVSVVLDGWRQHKDFAPPQCNGNALKSDRTGEVLYVDFQNFRVPNRRHLIRRVVTRGAERDLHWGPEYFIKGGRYPYQSIPEIAATGRRNSVRRWEAIVHLLRKADISLSRRVVLDIGCNAGVMVGYALAQGAHWALGWDQPVVARRARDLMLASGYTRFDIFEADLVPGYPLASDIPDHLTRLLPTSVVFYLAVRRHIGFLQELDNIPWQVMVYEGGEMESVDTLHGYLRDLSVLCPFEVAAVMQFRDGETGTRPLAILRRNM